VIGEQHERLLDRADEVAVAAAVRCDRHRLRHAARAERRSDSPRRRGDRQRGRHASDRRPRSPQHRRRLRVEAAWIACAERGQEE
jgi:hypothetical protein